MVPHVGDLAVAHLDAREDGLVEPAPGRRGGPGIGLGAVGGEAHGGFEDLLPLGEVGVDRGEAFLGTADIGGDAGLLSFQSGDVDGVGVVGVEELAPFGVGLGELAGEELALRRVAVLAGGDLGFQLLAQALPPGLGQFDLLVELFDLGFEVTGRDVGLLAAGRVPVLLAQAVEVLVTTLGELERQPSSAHPAEERALQVVVVATLPGSPGGAGREEVLDPVERGGVGERLVETGVLDPLPRDDPGVRLVRQDVGEGGDADGLHGAVTPAAVAQPSMGQFLDEAFERPLPGRVQLEGGGDVGGAFGVDDDVGDLAAADGLADVGVAERGGVGPAAHLGLLGHPLLDLAGEVGRVELGHEGVDALDETAGRGLLEVLGDRHERHTPAPQQGANRDVVFHVAGEAVDLVDHDRVDVCVLGDTGQHLLQLGPVGGAGGLAAVGVLVDEVPLAVADVADTSLALGGDGEAFLAFAMLGLLASRDPQVDHAAHRRPPCSWTDVSFLGTARSDLDGAPTARRSAWTSSARASSARARGRRESGSGALGARGRRSVPAGSRRAGLRNASSTLRSRRPGR
ncbi:MAG: hypothetical protein M0029_12040 [Actinomycetota bacterium]|nr:hypothetical protein [Actinomycetota bacterium]